MTDTRILDKNWRLKTLYFIKNKAGKRVVFKRNRAQQHFAEHAHTRNIICKSRQLGFTTYEAIDMLDDALFTKNFDALFIAQDLDTAKDIFSNKVDYSWSGLEDWLKNAYKVNADSARQLKFGLQDNSTSSITVDSSGRSGTYRRLHITEFASVCARYPDKAKEILEGSIPAVPIDGRVDIESTADGELGYFADIFWEAWNRPREPYPTEFKAHFYNWTWDDEEIAKIGEPIKNLPYEFLEYQRQHNLTDKEITYYYLKWLSLNKNWESLRKEYPTTPEEAFISSGNKLFSMERIRAMKVNAYDVVEWVENINDRERFFADNKGLRRGDWVFYAEPRLGHRYGIGADVAEGVGQDSSTATVIDFSLLKPRLVAEYANNHITPDIFAHELKNAGEKWCMATIGVERNNHGHTTIAILKTIYPERNIYKDEKEKLGWLTNLVTKPKMLLDLNTAVNEDLIDIPSKSILTEMQVYDKKELDDTRFDELKTKHYDLLMALGIAFQMKSSYVVITKAKQIKPSFARKVY